ncbi:TetR family transcriptional regulator [Cellulomonas sp. zg-ZUI199]|uniref:TetR family transcriptional regulator n=2 Tax=Cellulomonadaceae TaxID=85016 RepID=A0ABX8D244_9CELL|nr:TetR family transcriptional regulator [Cellulomonas wangleii]MBO0925440.1 TetR family transcriptional regulator [Cellulomonas wangleii]QVI61083.1 TetR family transcriptional regulator [Cellulomonas wangleii]
MARELLDLLWRDHPAAPRAGSRGPRSRVTTSQVVDAAVALADAEGVGAVTVRRLAARLGVAPNAVYSHVGARDDLLVLMVDAVHARQHRAAHPDTGWRARVTAVAEADLATYGRHPWLLDVDDQRTAFGPGTVAAYDHRLHAFDGTGLDDLDRDAAAAFVADFVRASARARRTDPPAGATAAVWARWADRLATYVGDRYALARRVGAVAGEAMAGPASAEHAWRFGLARVLDALDALVGAADDRPDRPGPDRAG